MKKLLLTAMFLSSAASAQTYLADPHAERPTGASGPGVQYTQTVLGKVIGVGAQVVKQIPTGIVCTKDGVREHSALNSGTAIGTVVGGVVGSRFGGGNGKKLATVAGAVIGGSVGNEVNRQHEYQTGHYQNQYQNGCETVFETRIVGWTYTAAYGGLQMQGMMVNRQPQLGEDVKVILTSTLYASE